MKNAMKKLTSLLLAAVLLVGVMPFGALAADFVPDAGMNDEVDVEINGSIVEEVVEEVVEDEPVFLTTLDNSGDAYGAITPQADEGNGDDGANAPAAKVEYQVKLVYDDGTATYLSDTNTADETTAAYEAAALILGNEKMTELALKYNFNYSAETLADANGVLTINCYLKPAETCEVTVRINGGSESEPKELTVGTKLTLNEALLTQFALALPEGYGIDNFRIAGNTYNVNAEYTVAADSEIVVYTKVGSSNNGTTGGTTTGGNTTTGGTTTPVGTVKVTFYDIANKPITDAAFADANGKLSTMYVDYVSILAERSGYKFLGWKLNGAGDPYTANQIISSLSFTTDTYFTPAYEKIQSSVINSTKNQNDIFLNIFVNKDFQNCKTIKLNEHWVIADDKVTKDEILQYVVTDYYKAANGNIGLQADMLYYSVGSFMYNWLTDNGTLTIDNISAKRAQGTVTINIMVTNAAVTGSSAAADTSNPKTGDEIYTAMAVMGISAASLAAVMYFYNKKRMAI